jgi:hypothetical protein
VKGVVILRGLWDGMGYSENGSGHCMERKVHDYCIGKDTGNDDTGDTHGVWQMWSLDATRDTGDCSQSDFT